MRIFEAVNAPDVAAFRDAHRARESRSVSVKRDDQRALESARVEGGRGVRHVVLVALELRQETEFRQSAFEILLPGLVIGLGFVPPLARSLFSQVSRQDAFRARQTVKSPVEKRLLHLLIGISKTVNRLRAVRHFRQSFSNPPLRAVDGGRVEKFFLALQILAE